jgi:hypothetical protein
MHMATYGESVRVLHPIIKPIFTALEAGLEASAEEHARRKFRREDDPRYFSYTARRVACDELVSKGIQATEEHSGRPLMQMSGLLVAYKGFAVKILRYQVNAAGTVIIPPPGRSRRNQKFWRQDAGGALPGLQTDNLLLLWQDDAGVLVDTMTLARPRGGDHRRDSLRLDWHGPLTRAMAGLRAADLDELKPAVDYQQLGDEEAG